ncbi:uncharacterized protein LOC102810200 [Saccoglossus kowalevskii]|uniref:Zinc finger protein 135-like n=1 Tax=Saccoglossus kowalevskii TaxID=10224 RepID=A0ABM0M5B8_SACKO|nr:PREDICTED: zinc finger protein 135-like [Saccoglossus kowalevskii]
MDQPVVVDHTNTESLYNVWQGHLQQEAASGGRHSPGDQRKLVGDSFTCSKCNQVFPNAMAQISHEMGQCHHNGLGNHSNLHPPQLPQPQKNVSTPAVANHESPFPRNENFTANRSDSLSSSSSPGDISQQGNRSPSPGEVHSHRRGRPKNSPMVHTPQPVFTGHMPGQVPREYKCKICPHVYYTKADMQRHARSHVENKPYKCTHCDKTFANSSYLSQHSRVHTGEKPYVCGRCGKCFKQLSHLQQHTRTHTGEKPYQCNIPGCGKAFTQLANLQQHSRRHNKDKPFKCPHCYRVYGDLTSLQAHVPSHANSRHEKKYPCGVCGKSYTQESYLMKHMLKHPTEPQFARDFPCAVCGKKFSQQAYLERHVLKRHSNQGSNSSTSQAQSTNSNNDNDNSSKVVNSGLSSPPANVPCSIPNSLISSSIATSYGLPSSSKHPILNVPMMPTVQEMRSALGLMPTASGPATAIPGISNPPLHGLNDPRAMLPVMFPGHNPVTRGIDMPLMRMRFGDMSSTFTTKSPLHVVDRNGVTTVSTPTTNSIPGASSFLTTTSSAMQIPFTQ